MIKAVRAKLHGIRVTGADLDYHGSVTLDPEICRAAGMYPLEFVNIWNKNTGRRITTYILFGEPGSRCCVLNGAAARTCMPGDEVIICAVEYLSGPERLCALRPQILMFDGDNNITEHLQYAVGLSDEGDFSCEVRKATD